jgi:molybdopterin synthase sulfur carrier subunit
MEIKVLFFGVLTEVTGTAIKHYRNVKSIGSLKLRLIDDYPEIIHFDFRIALNNEMINSDHELNEGDEIALMPPFAGG